MWVLDLSCDYNYIHRLIRSDSVIRSPDILFTAESASSSIEQKELSGIDKCFEDLKEKHVDGKYTLEQLRMWAHLIQMGKHSSTDEPPDKPFWQGRKRSHSSVKSPVKKVEEQLLSPSKKVSLGSELLDQLSKWHKLNESGVITGSEYEELKCTILQDIKQLSLTYHALLLAIACL